MADDLKTRIAALPADPGVYLMKDERSAIIYVGKAKNLSHRVSSYFSTSRQQDYKTELLVREVKDIDVIITRTEVEALLLERTLIKHHVPKFNINLLDDKQYPFLRINFEEEWPRLEIVRRRRDDGATYLGPFGNVGMLRTMVAVAQRIFPLVRCSRHEFENAKRPCNYYQLGMCLGPCTLPVERADYIAAVNSALALLRGQSRELARDLKQRMQSASAAQDYERAAQYRDQIQALQAVAERQNVVLAGIKAADCVSVAESARRLCFNVTTIRDDKVVANDSYIVESLLHGASASFGEFLLQYYEHRSVPAQVLVPYPFEDHETTAAALSLSHGGAHVEFVWILPEKGGAHGKRRAKGAAAADQTWREVLALSQRNAQYALEQAEGKHESRSLAAQALAHLTGLRRVPRVIECIDISHLQGSDTVASLVTFVEGQPDKSRYRQYRVRGSAGKPDDYASIEEVVQRRLERGVREDTLPDLLVIDGGRGQLGAALKAKHTFPGLDLEIISLAKSRSFAIGGTQTVQTDERVFRPDQDEPIALKPGTPEFRLLTHLRDEAHRFAITKHRKSRTRTTIKSELDDIDGIGPKIRTRLLREFGDVGKIKALSVDELIARGKVPRALAERILAKLQASVVA